MGRPIFHSFALVLLLTLLTTGLFWFVYIFVMLKERLASKGAVFPTALFATGAAALVIGEVMSVIASEGTRSLARPALGLLIAAHLLFIVFFAIVIPRGQLHPMTWVMPALVVAAILPLVAADPRTRAYSEVLDVAFWIPAALLFFVAWYLMHRDLMQDHAVAAADAA